VRPGTRSVTFVGYHEAIPFIQKETKRLTRKRSSKCRVSMSEDMIAQGGDELMLERRASAPGSLLAGGKEEAEDPMEEDLEEGEEEEENNAGGSGHRRVASLSLLSELAAVELTEAPHLRGGDGGGGGGGALQIRLEHPNPAELMPLTPMAGAASPFQFSAGGPFPAQQQPMQLQLPNASSVPLPSANQDEPNAHLRALMASPFLSAMTSLYILASMSDRELLLCHPETPSLSAVSTPAGPTATVVTI